MIKTTLSIVYITAQHVTQICSYAHYRKYVEADSMADKKNKTKIALRETDSKLVGSDDPDFMNVLLTDVLNSMWLPEGTSEETKSMKINAAIEIQTKYLTSNRTLQVSNTMTPISNRPAYPANSRTTSADISPILCSLYLWQLDLPLLDR